jgi:hypothetical protein
MDEKIRRAERSVSDIIVSIGREASMGEAREALINAVMWLRRINLPKPEERPSSPCPCGECEVVYTRREESRLVSDKPLSADTLSYT